MAQPWIFTHPLVPVETDETLRAMAEMVGVRPAVFVRAALENFTGTGEGIERAHLPRIASIRTEASRRPSSSEVVRLTFNLLPPTDARLRDMAEAFGVRHYDFVRHALEAFTGTGHAAKDRKKAASRLRSEIRRRLGRLGCSSQSPENYRKELRKKRRTERGGLSQNVSERRVARPKTPPPEEPPLPVRRRP